MPSAHGNSSAAKSATPSMSENAEQHRAAVRCDDFGARRGAFGHPQTLLRWVVLNAAPLIDEQVVPGAQRGHGRRRVHVRIEEDVVRIEMVGGAIAEIM